MVSAAVREEVRQRLAAVWLNPLSLDPSRRSARVTREIADQLASLASETPLYQSTRTAQTFCVTHVLLVVTHAVVGVHALQADQAPQE